MTSAQKDLKTANTTIRELISKYKDEFGFYQCINKNIESVLSNQEDIINRKLSKMITDVSVNKTLVMKSFQ